MLTSTETAVIVVLFALLGFGSLVVWVETYCTGLLRKWVWLLLSLAVMAPSFYAVWEKVF